MGKDILDEINTKMNVAFLQAQLLNWGRENRRSYPWRNTLNPYHILISEVMLHRTQASQVVPIYREFIERFPDVISLAKASKEEIHEIMYSLGLRWRTDLLHEMAIILNGKFAGEIPKDRKQLQSLPGVSEYIAGAVRCFAWNLIEPIADTNTVRIVGRIFGLVPNESSRRSKKSKDLLNLLVSPDRSREFNYALLDLGNKVCTKRIEPDCKNCPLQKMCKHGMQRIV